ncbi:MAG: molybdenum cofactor synthesis domain-containing protein, partial [Glaciecola sp.]
MHNRDQAYKVLEASMLVIGDEILGGFVQDTNSHWLAGQLMEVGVPLSRVSTVPDTFEDIAEALATELARARPRVIVTSGGVGSTPDDITFEAVAAALGQTVREEPLLRERIDTAIGWAADLGMDMGNGYA